MIRGETSGPGPFDSGSPLPQRKGKQAKRGPASRLQQQIEAVEQLPKTKQQFVSQMLDTVLAQGVHR